MKFLYCVMVKNYRLAKIRWMLDAIISMFLHYYGANGTLEFTRDTK